MIIKSEFKAFQYRHIYHMTTCGHQNLRCWRCVTLAYMVTPSSAAVRSDQLTLGNGVIGIKDNKQVIGNSINNLSRIIYPN